MKHLYLHVPFCTSICYYCDFKRNIYDEPLVNDWLKEIEKELNHKMEHGSLETIYIGGGTPSCLSIAQLETLLKLLQPYAKDIREYTIESNIESATHDKIMLMQRYGINRISLGVQSLQNDLLTYMNRKHTKEDVEQCLIHLHEWGMSNVSIDLMYGFANQTLAMWEHDLLAITSNPYIQHISLYSLTIEDNSVFSHKGVQTCDNELEATMYQRAIEILTRHGFIQYEIANFAKQGYASMHNQAYWHYADFYGIGVGASGKQGDVRYTNEGSIMQYIQGNHQVETIPLRKEDKMFEHIMMSLRMRKGLNIKHFESLYEVSFLAYYGSKIAQRLKAKDLIINDQHIYVSNEAMFYLHDVLIDFME